MSFDTSSHTVMSPPPQSGCGTGHSPPHTPSCPFRITLPFAPALVISYLLLVLTKSVAFSWGHINGTMQSVAFLDYSALIFNLVTVKWDSASRPWEHELCSETASKLASMGRDCQSGKSVTVRTSQECRWAPCQLPPILLSTPFTNFHPAYGPNAFLPTNLPLPTATTMKDFHAYS